MFRSPLNPRTQSPHPESTRRAARCLLVARFSRRARCPRAPPTTLTTNSKSQFRASTNFRHPPIRHQVIPIKKPLSSQAKDLKRDPLHDGMHRPTIARNRPTSTSAPGTATTTPPNTAPSSLGSSCSFRPRSSPSTRSASSGSTSSRAANMCSANPASRLATPH